MSEIDITTLPSESWDRRHALLLHDISERVAAGVTFLRDEYSDRALLEVCQTFIFHDLDDAPRSDWNSLKRVWYFPWTEIQCELSETLNHSLLASYKATFDNFRRALELAVVGSYFVQEHVPEADAREWLYSERDTPPFSRALPLLLRNPRFKEVDAATSWSSELKALYWRLCDVVHVRGMNAGFQRLQPSHLHFVGVSSVEFSLDAIRLTADTFIETVRHVATIVALENPVLLVGLDICQKFGLNPPVSGFFEEPQSERLRGLLLPSVRDCILALAQQDDEVKSIQNWIDSLPNMTTEQVAEQVQHQREFLDSMRSRPPDKD